MQNPRLAARYAKSLMDIAIEQGKLDTMYQDMQGIHAMCESSSELVSMLKSPIVNADLKNKTLKALLETRVDGVTMSFIRLVINKGREFFLPEIVTSFVTLYKQHNKINEVVLTTASQIDEEMKAAILTKIQQQFKGMTIELTTVVNEKLIGGFLLETNNTLFDASILRDLNDIKKQFLKNEYVPDLK
jgi:F-type H+-transporting ATPase subunit delta